MSKLPGTLYSKHYKILKSCNRFEGWLLVVKRHGGLWGHYKFRRICEGYYRKLR